MTGVVESMGAQLQARWGWSDSASRWQLPFPGKPAGTVNADMPFDHLIVVMMENHSFDNLFGELGTTRSDVDALSFDGSGTATNSNPGPAAPGGRVTAFPFGNTAQTDSHAELGCDPRADQRRRDGRFCALYERRPRTDGLLSREVLPFAYSLATQFTIGDRWFCSMPGPTYPNRRFLLAGTAYGGTHRARDAARPAAAAWDDLRCPLSSQHQLVRLLQRPADDVGDPVDHPQAPRHLAPISKFFHDCQAGTLPAVSFVDPASDPVRYRRAVQIAARGREERAQGVGGRLR